MKSLKNFFTYILASAICLTFYSCGGKGNLQEDNRAINSSEPAISRVSLSEDHVSAKPFIEKTYVKQIGLQVKKPLPLTEDKVGLSCQTSCDMYVPRSVVVHLSIPKKVQAAYQRNLNSSWLRLDVTSLSTGFQSGDFATIKLNNIERILFTPESSAQPINSSGQILLNTVKNFQIVDRPTDLPLFKSQYLMQQLLPSMPVDQQAFIQHEIETGSLNQVRVLGQSEQIKFGQTSDVISLTGMAPGLNYTFRIVDESDAGATTMSTDICHIPVCPADFAQ